MYNNVVSGVFNKFTQNGISCLRFNFRGVGNSSGNHTAGTGELSDTKTCIDFLVNEKHFEKILICGYCFILLGWDVFILNSFPLFIIFLV